MSTTPVPDDHQFETIETEDTTWRFDRGFLGSNWQCLWGRGCKGILSEPSEHLQQGCCSVGAELDGEAEAMNVAALAATLPPERFQFHAAAMDGGVFRDGQRTSTRVVEDACIFLNRPGFAGGAGCALHLAAIDAGESPVDWKPSVCWQLPIKVEWADRGDGGEIATVRRWRRTDWGDDEDHMVWWCTEDPAAYTAASPVIDTMAGELAAILHDQHTGDAVFVELRRRLHRT